MLELHGTAAAIWRSLAAGRSRADVVEEMRRRYRATESTASDVAQLIDQLLDRSLIGS